MAAEADNTTGARDTLRASFAKKLGAHLADAIGEVPNAVTALDLACGRGDALFEVASKLTLDSRIVALSDKREDLNLLHERLKLKEQGRVVYPRFEHPDRLPFADNVFDHVWAGPVDSTLEPIRPSLRTAIRVLKPGGSLVIVAILRDTLVTFMRMVGKYVAEQDDSVRARPLVLDHARALDKAGWEEAMRRSGATEVTIDVQQFDWQLTVPLASDPIMLDCFAPFGLAPETEAGKEQLAMLNAMVTEPVTLPISLVVAKGKKPAA